MNCTTLTWSSITADELSPTIVVCSIAVVIHIIFWIQLIPFSSLRKKNLIWLYSYLITDFFLLTRFFIMYSMRHWRVCLYPTLRMILCYWEASSKFYTNTVQSYILLALNVCRCAQIIFNRNVFVQNPRLIILTHLLIYILPALNVIIQFLGAWTQLWRKAGEACDIQYVSLSVQIFNLFFVYIIPVTLSLIIIGICIRHVSSIRGIRSQQIINLRRKYKRTLLTQTIIFYSIWLALWSPNLLAFQFINVNTQPGIYTSLLNYIEIAMDPILVATIDVRFFHSWRIVWRKIKARRQRTVAPVVPADPKQEY
ncbi:unnamed protein product [Rotaria sp. Silwood2]|nr:unnamed protein product [Rotaria sp. Silwood2]CAF3990197.1 unnamed protein product [Rotaria sp. Silwood2]